MKSSAFGFKEVSKHFQNIKALDGISLDIPENSIFGLLGPNGSGKSTLMRILAGLIQSLAEGLHFSKKVGLETEDVIEVISKGAAQSWQMDNRWKSMIEDDYNHGFAVDLMRKDLGIVLEHAKTVDAKLEVTDLVNSFYENIQKIGGGRWDTSSLLKRLES